MALYFVKLLLAYSLVRYLAEPLIVAASTRGALTRLGLSAAMKTACCAVLLITEVRPAMVVIGTDSRGWRKGSKWGGDGPSGGSRGGVLWAAPPHFSI